MNVYFDEEIWFLNHYGTAGQYKVSRFNKDGTIHLPAFACANPFGSIAHFFQPSAIRVDGVTKLFVVGETTSGNFGIHLFTSTDNIAFSYYGQVFTPNGSEPNGITQANVFYDENQPDPFLMYYVVRGMNGPGSIAVASSPDGVTWTRHGTVLSPSGSDETYGISLGWVCKDPDNGDMVLWYNGFSTSDYMATTGKIARSSNPLGPFGNKTTIVSPDGLTFTLASGSSGNAYGIMASGQTSPVGVPMVIEGPSQAYQEVVTVIRQEGDYVHFERPLRFTHSNRPFHSSIRNKILPTFAKENPDGSWYGIFTSFGAAPGLTTEYTIEYSAPEIDGPWSPLGTGLKFKPWFGQGLYSTENPTPLQVVED